jgi:uncharacterized lipoprotein YddW (UPF0748 family)
LSDTTDVPYLIVEPTAVTLRVYADRSALVSGTVSVRNIGGDSLDWTAELAPGGGFTPTLVPTAGVQGISLTLAVDSAPYQGEIWPLTLTRRITVTAMPSTTLASPQIVTATLLVDPHVPHLWLETNDVLFNASALSPGVYTRTVQIKNTGGYSLTWGAQASGVGLVPRVDPTAGVQDGVIHISVDTHGYPSTTALYTGHVVVTASWDHDILRPVLDAPQVIQVRLQTQEQLAYMPYMIRDEPPTPTPTPTATPTPTPTPTPTATPTPDVGAEVRAIWVHRYDWTSAIRSESPEDIDEIAAKVAGAGFNTIYLQVRANGDAYYTPGLEPWSSRLNDANILGQNPGWDPLARLIEQAHARGVQVHAYINVFPAWLGTAPPLESAQPQHVFWKWWGQYGAFDWRQWHQTYGAMNLNTGYLWASPGVDGVRDHVVAVASDLLSRYHLDGLHLDLVRYANNPYSYDPISNLVAGSQKSFERDDWQRGRVTDLVSRVYNVLRDVRPQARLSAAVWFCYAPDGCGYGLSSGYDDYYQDSLGWLAQGVIDGIAPMLYEWQGFDNLEIWRDVMLQFQRANAGRHVYPGISGDFSNFSEIANRIQAARDAGAAGHAIFSYGGVDTRGYWDDFASGPYSQPARIAPLSWR